MAWCTLAHLQRELAISMSITTWLALVVEICTGTPKARLSSVLLQGQILRSVWFQQVIKQLVGWHTCEVVCEDAGCRM
eukprot:3078573-Rhodomonas_salina.1